MKISAKKARKRQNIINAAIKLYIKFGAQGTSMQLLAKKADIATGSIYNYFDNKETLLSTIYHQILDEEREYLLEGYDENQSLEERFTHLGYRFAIFRVNNPDKFEFLNHYTASETIMASAKAGEFPDHPIRSIIDAGKKSGVTYALSDEELIYFVLGGVTSLLRWKLFAQETIDDDEIHAIIKMAWYGIMRPNQL